MKICKQKLPKYLCGMISAAKQKNVILLIVLAGLLLVVALSSVHSIISTPSPEYMKGNSYPGSVSNTYEYEELVFYSEDDRPLIAFLFKSKKTNKKVLKELEVRLVTSERPHAVYLNDKMVRAARNEFVLLANTPDGKIYRIPLSSKTALGYFGLNSDHPRKDVVSFWQNHIAPEIPNRQMFYHLSNN